MRVTNQARNVRQTKPGAYGRPWVHTIEVRTRQGNSYHDREFSIVTELDSDEVPMSRPDILGRD